MADLAGSKQSLGCSKSTLKDPAFKTNGKPGMRQALVARWDNSPERPMMQTLWDKYGTMIILLGVVFAMLIYSIVAIAVSGFQTAKWFFTLTMFFWFCLTYSFLRKNCGQDVYRSVIKPCTGAIESQWYWLKW